MTDSFKCLACNHEKYHMVLDMGDVPLANAFIKDLSDTADQNREPLSLVMCPECDLLQIKDEVDRTKLFSNYLWMTSTSAGAKAHAEKLSTRLWEKFGSDEKQPFLVEVASNDGFFLEHYRDVGFDILGVDPSNFAQEANDRGVPSIRDFFGVKVVDKILETREKPEVMVARNVLGHSSELQDLIAGMKKLLAPEGTLVLELPYAYMLRAELQYDTIFHEHLSYLTVGSLHNLFKRFGLKITDVDFVHMNGGSLLCEVKHEENETPANDHSMRAFEEFIGLNSIEGWRSFTKDVNKQRRDLVALLEKLKSDGKKVVSYGAAAKYMTMLNYCDIKTDLISACGDANDRKQGLLCPGVHIPVVSPKELMDMDPDYVLIGAWNFKTEIINLLRNDYGFKGEFIMPLPYPEIISD
ncbi:class I SAM-dependent methyltransferase [Glaciecola petra]|uniref:Class I SAM-dependent methyltransferase n=1 Tax=Glaciecola petra TaxID=3075602 RepID=A0ABU2ZMA2_9ALTE|nr:class I SAM-dependent methyltransferase [Aestuariibacter sp. P117]MDT0593759.1 class I SAM-dependent methyltransferase [Aestuariibacter sp. P117]